MMKEREKGRKERKGNVKKVNKNEKVKVKKEHEEWCTRRNKIYNSNYTSDPSFTQSLSHSG